MVLHRERRSTSPHYYCRGRSLPIGVTIHDCIHLMFRIPPTEPRNATPRVDVAAVPAFGSYPHRVGSLEAGHPPLLQRSAEKMSLSTTPSTSISVDATGGNVARVR